jgi:tetratricopeptide (TPR) repeat protein
MPIFETPGGTRREIHLPNVEWPELKKAIDEYAKHKTRMRATRSRLGFLNGEKQRVEQAATVALKTAIRDGKGEKGVADKFDEKLAQIDSEAADCDRLMRALDQALDEAEADLILVVDDHRDEWLDELEGEVASALDEYRAAIEVVEKKRGDLSRVYALRSWVRGFPEEVESFVIGRGVLPKLKSLNGAPYFVSDVFAALRDDASPQAPAGIEPFKPIIEPLKPILRGR